MRARDKARKMFAAICIRILTYNGLRYWQVGGRGQCLEAEKLEARKLLENSQPSAARGVRWRYWNSDML